MTAPLTRRRMLTLSGAAVLSVPLVFFARPAPASTNAAQRAALKYQPTPNGISQCANCLEFLPGASDSAPGGCKLMPGDDEISPSGYCTAWNTM